MYPLEQEFEISQNKGLYDAADITKDILERNGKDDFETCDFYFVSVGVYQIIQNSYKYKN